MSIGTKPVTSLIVKRTLISGQHLLCNQAFSARKFEITEPCRVLQQLNAQLPSSLYLRNLLTYLQNLYTAAYRISCSSLESILVLHIQTAFFLLCLGRGSPTQNEKKRPGHATLAKILTCYIESKIQHYVSKFAPEVHVYVTNPIKSDLSNYTYIPFIVEDKDEIWQRYLKSSKHWIK